MLSPLQVSLVRVARYSLQSQSLAMNFGRQFALSSSMWKSLLAIVLLFCPTAPAAEKLSVNAIADVLWDHPNSISVREMLTALTESTADRSSTAFATIFSNACRLADAETFPDLVRIFDALPPESYKKEILFTPLADAWLRLRISPNLLQTPVVSEMIAASAAADPNDYQSELHEAVREYERIKAPFLTLKKGKVDFQTNQGSYWNLVSRLLRQEGGPWTEDLFAYRWGGYCGTGQHRFEVPQSRAILMALVADQRWSEAAGAALEVTPSADPEPSLRILETCVADPLKPVVGYLAALDLHPRGFSKRMRQATLLGFLLRLPGDDRVRLLTELASSARFESLPLYFAAIGKFISSPAARDKNALPYGGRWRLKGTDSLNEVTAQPVGPVAQQQALDFLVSQASPELAIEPAITLARIFSAKPRVEALPGLRRLLDHPSLTVATEAATALKLAGENVLMPPKLGPVRYRIEVDGKPYAMREVEWLASWDGSSLGISSEKTTDSLGICELPRDLFLDKSAKPITHVILRNARTPGPGDALFSIQLPAPPSNDDIILVSVQTRPL